MGATTHALTVTVAVPEPKRYVFKIDKQWMDAAETIVRTTKDQMPLGAAVGAVINRQIVAQFGAVEYDYALEDVLIQQTIDTGSAKAF
jgi:hypothetical protein